MQGELREAIHTMVRTLENLMKSLTKYIEEKRECFPRLYFLSNEQIIEMCGVLEDIQTLERSFHKMFEGIDKVVIVYQEHYLDRDQRLALLDRIEKDRIKLEQQTA